MPDTAKQHPMLRNTCTRQASMWRRTWTWVEPGAYKATGNMLEDVLLVFTFLENPHAVFKKLYIYIYVL